MSIEAELKRIGDSLAQLATYVATMQVPSAATTPAADLPAVGTTPPTPTQVPTGASPISLPGSGTAAADAVENIFGGLGGDPAATTPQPTIDDVKVAVKAYMDKNGEEAAVKLIQKYGATRITEIKEENYAAIIADTQ